MKKERRTRVYHYRNPAVHRQHEYGAWLEIGYRFVAEVDTDDVREAYYLTNDNDMAWGEPERVIYHVPRCRSTSPGDIIVPPDGRVVMVMRAGYVELPMGCSRWLDDA